MTTAVMAVRRAPATPPMSGPSVELMEVWGGGEGEGELLSLVDEGDLVSGGEISGMEEDGKWVDDGRLHDSELTSATMIE